MSVLKPYSEWTGPYLKEKISFIGFRSFDRPLNIDDKTCVVLDSLFEKFQVFKNMSKFDDQEGYCFYFRLPKGTADEWDNYYDLKETYGFKNKKEFYKFFNRNFSKKWYWFHVSFFRSQYLKEKYYLISFNGRTYFYAQYGSNVSDKNNKYLYDCSWFVAPLMAFADDLVKSAMSQKYKRWVEKNLDYRLRNGQTTYRKYWEVYPEMKEGYLENYKGINVEEFINDYKKGLMTIVSATRFKTMTANKYCELFKIATDSIGLSYDDNLSLQQNFHKNSDGRNHDLDTIEPDSIDAFNEWYKNQRYGFDHTFELRNKYGRIDLIPEKDQDGYYLRINGGDFYSCIDVMKIYLALKNNGILSHIYLPQHLIDNYTGEALYFARGESLFHNNFPKARIKKYIKAIDWDPLHIIETK